MIKLLPTLFALGAAVASSSLPPSAHGQDTIEAVDVAAAPVRPFGVGETLVYDVAVGGARVGQGQMQVTEWDTVGGTPTLHSVFTTKGGLLWYKVDDRYESWFEPTTMVSHRFVQKINEGGYHKDRYTEIYPARGIFQQRGYEEMPSVARPLDDASFFYFIRTVPLEVGETYSFDRYYRPDKNPVTIKVLRKERITVPAGTFNTIVIQPVIKSGGLFGDGGEAYIWLTDDDRRLMVQMKSKVKVLKSLDLYLKSYQPPESVTAVGAPRR